MIKVEYIKKGTTVYYFDSILLKPIETIVNNVIIFVPDVGDPNITYEVESSNLSGNIKLPSKLVFEDKEELKNTILKGFEIEIGVVES